MSRRNPLPKIVRALQALALDDAVRLDKQVCASVELRVAHAFHGLNERDCSARYVAGSGQVLRAKAGATG